MINGWIESFRVEAVKEVPGSMVDVRVDSFRVVEAVREVPSISGDDITIGRLYWILGYSVVVTTLLLLLIFSRQDLHFLFDEQ